MWITKAKLGLSSRSQRGEHTLGQHIGKRDWYTEIIINCMVINVILWRREENNLEI